MDKTITKAEQRRKLHELILKYKEQKNLLRLIVCKRGLVIIRFAGHEETFTFSEGQVTRLHNKYELDSVDANVLFSLALMAHGAVVSGYKNIQYYENYEVQVTTSKVVVKESPLLANARSTRLYQEILGSERPDYLKILVATGEEVTLRLGDFEHHFEMFFSQARRVPGSRFLYFEDFAFLVVLAEEVMEAVFAGYRHGKDRKKSKRQNKGVQLELPLSRW